MPREDEFVFTKIAPSTRGQSVQGDNNTVVGRDYVTHQRPEFASTPSDVLKVVQKLDTIIDAKTGSSRNYGTPSEIDTKLAHNAVERFEEFIRDYGQYGHAVLDAFRSLEANQPSIGARVKRFIRSIYHEIVAKKKGQCGDDILEQVVERLRQLTGQVPDVSLEVVLPTCNMLVAHAFISCDILKRAPAQVSNAAR